MKYKREHEKIQQAKVRFAQAFLYFAPHVHRIKFFEDAVLAGPTMGIDKYWRVYYNPAWVEACNAGQNVFNIYHEIGHPLLDFWGRQKGRDQKIWNIAHDLEINSGRMREIAKWDPTTGRKIKCPMELPEGIMTPERFGFPHGLLVEAYYELLMKQGKKNVEDFCDQNNMKVCGVCESGIGPDGEGAKTPEGKISEAQGEIMKHQIAKDIESHAKNQGFVSDDLKFFVERTLRPQVNWKKELRSVVRTQMIKTLGRDDFTYARRSRRDVPGIVLPGTQAHLPVAAVVIDTSGSMDKGAGGDLDVALTETAGILNLYKGRFFVHVLSVDTQVKTAQKLFKANAIQLGGGGGTDMVIGFEAAMKLRPKPDVIVMVTDGYTGWPSKPPSAKCIIVCTTNQETPAWAKTIRVKKGVA